MELLNVMHGTKELAANEQISQIKRPRCRACETQSLQLSCSLISLTYCVCLGVKLEEANRRVVEIRVRTQLLSVPKV